MRVLVYISFFFVLPISSYSQILVSGGLEFTSTHDSLRQIKNVSKADSLSHALTVNDQLFNRFITSNMVVIVDTVIQINTNFEFPSYTPGMLLYIQLPSFPDSLLYPNSLKINDLSIQNIKMINQSSIDTSAVKSGRIINIAYDGTQFIILNTPVFVCPSGYKKMSDDYCIQIRRNPLATFWNAQKNCYDQGAHLCYYAEWYYACINNTDLINMPQHYEWINTTSNHNLHALKIGHLSNCNNRDSETTATSGLPMYYRCCYKLR